MKKVFAALSIALSSCASVSNDAIITSAGEQPPAAFYEEYVRSRLLAGLKDPDSLKQFVVYPPYRRTMQRGVFNGGGNDEAWLVCYSYNAKNSYGAYAGSARGGMLMQQSGPTWVDLGNLRALATLYCS